MSKWVSEWVRERVSKRESETESEWDREWERESEGIKLIVSRVQKECLLQRCCETGEEEVTNVFFWWETECASELLIDVCKRECKRQRRVHDGRDKTSVWVSEWMNKGEWMSKRVCIKRESVSLREWEIPSVCERKSEIDEWEHGRVFVCDRE